MIINKCYWDNNVHSGEHRLFGIATVYWTLILNLPLIIQLYLLKIKSILILVFYSKCILLEFRMQIKLVEINS